MEEKSIRKRNLIGSFFGGFLGILAFGQIHPATLPLGCLLGVIVGWWHQEIWKSATDSWARELIRANERLNAYKSFFSSPIQRTRKSVKFADELFQIAEILDRLFNYVVKFVTRIITSPVAFVRWLKKNEVRRAYFLRWLAAIAYWEINSIWIIPLIYNEHIGQSNVPEDIFLFVYIPTMIGIIFSLGMPVMYIATMPETSFARIKKIRSDYNRTKPVLFFLRDIFKMILLQVSMICFMIAAITWTISAGGFVFLAIMLPVAFFAGAIKGIYRASTQSGHYLCFGVTLATTALVAWKFHYYMENPYLLWVVALATGIISAILTEALRRLFVIIISNNEKLLSMTDSPAFDHAKPFWRYFSSPTEWLGKKVPAFIFC